MTPTEVLNDALRWLASNTPRRAKDRSFVEIDIRAATAHANAGDWPRAAHHALEAIRRCPRQPAALMAQLEEVTRE